MTARGVGKKTKAAPGKRGGRRAVPRASLARRSRAAQLGRGRFNSSRTAARSREKSSTRVELRPPPDPTAGRKQPEADPKPRKPSKAMVALMRGWRAEERKAAQRIVDFFECRLRLVKGRGAGARFLLQPWQERMLRIVFGRLRPNGTRWCRTLYLFVARKNAKSTLAGGLAIYLAFEDGEPGAEVYCAAKDRQQAKIVFKSAKAMVDQSPYLSEKITAFQNLLEAAGDETTFLRAISADAGSQQGLDPHGIIVDELHVHPNRDLLDTLESATGARQNYLEVIITTAGVDRHSIAWEKHAYALKVASGEVEDPTFHAAIFAADEADDWTLEETWKKANPNLGVSVNLDYLREQCKKAQETPTYENAFRRYHLNQWTAQETRWMPMEAWDACSAPFEESELHGQVCFAGLDLGSTRDLTALVLVFPQRPADFVPPPPADPPADPGEEGGAQAGPPDSATAPGVGALEHDYFVVARFFMPEETLLEHIKTDGVPYDLWARTPVGAGKLLTLTKGNVIDYRAIRATITAEFARFRMKDLAYDRYGASQISQELEMTLGKDSNLSDGEQLQVIQFPQTIVSMSNPTKDLLTLVRSGKLHHGGNPILQWMANCCVAMQDTKGNIMLAKPDRRTSSNRIDGMIALVMALDRAMRNTASVIAGDKSRSVYEDRGILVF